MARLLKTTLTNGWHGLKDRAALAARLPSRIDASRPVSFLRRGLADLVFPPSCVSCQAELGVDGALGHSAHLCDECCDGMDLFSEPMCVRCGAPLPVASRGNTTTAIRPMKQGCIRCAGHKIWFDETVALGLYSEKLREIVLRMKRAEGDSLSLAVGRLMLEKRGNRLAEIGADVVAPIPLHWRRRLAHRTNSAAVLAEVLAGRLGVPLAERMLRRSRSTLRQFDLTPPERWKNVRRAFSVRAGYHLRKAHVLLVDDVLTTGATCSEAAWALRQAGAARVTVAVVARAMG